MLCGAIASEPIRELWLEYVMSTLCQFADILRAQDQMMVARSLWTLLEPFKDEIVNCYLMFVPLIVMAFVTECLHRPCLELGGAFVDGVHNERML
jgi:hypothetical protein